jgi:hypothetical protein
MILVAVVLTPEDLEGRTITLQSVVCFQVVELEIDSGDC